MKYQNREQQKKNEENKTKLKEKIETEFEILTHRDSVMMKTCIRTKAFQCPVLVRRQQLAPNSFVSSGVDANVC